MNDNGYVKLYRKCLNNVFFLELPFDRWRAFEYLVLNACFADTDFMKMGKIVKLKRGQFLTSDNMLAKEWGWSVNKVRRYLDTLVKLGMITKNGSTLGTVITVENYTFYQGESNRVNEHSNEHSGEHSNEHSGEHSGEQNKKVKKDKKVKKEKNIYITPLLGEFENVKLTSEQLEKLMDRFTDYQDRIEALSEYMKSHNKSYSDHYATILSWERREKKKQSEEKQKGRNDFLK